MGTFRGCYMLLPLQISPVLFQEIRLSPSFPRSRNLHGVPGHPILEVLGHVSDGLALRRVAFAFLLRQA